MMSDGSLGLRLYLCDVDLTVVVQRTESLVFSLR